MKKYLITSMLCILAVSVYAQTGTVCPPVDVVWREYRETIESKIKEKTVESKITNSHYASRLNMSAEGFMELADASKEAGHNVDSDFDNWEKRAGNNAKYYMLNTVASGKVHLYYEKLDKETPADFQQYLPKGTHVFDEKAYNAYFGGIDFSKNHWQAGGDVHARLADMRRLAVAVSKDLGITIDPDKITFRLFEVQQVKGLPPPRILIPTTTERNDNVGGFENNGSIAIDAAKLKNGSISDAISTMMEEVYHAYQRSEVEKLKLGDKRREDSEKVWDWMDSFNDDNRNGYAEKVNDLQKQIDAETNAGRLEKLKEQREAAYHAYYNLKHEKDAKEFAGKVAAMEYFVRNVQKSYRP
jgi:hypothetical protein